MAAIFTYILWAGAENPPDVTTFPVPPRVGDLVRTERGLGTITAVEWDSSGRETPDLTLHVSPKEEPA